MIFEKLSDIEYYLIHGMRIKRHDHVAQYIAHNADERGMRTIRELRLQTSTGLRKPDFIIKGDTAHVVNVQIDNNDNIYLEVFNNNKINYYRSIQYITSLIMREFSVYGEGFAAITLVFKGLAGVHRPSV